MKLSLFCPKKISLLTLLTAIFTSQVHAVPSIENLSVDPPPSADWIIGSTTAAPVVTTVRIQFDGAVSQSCLPLPVLATVGWMVDNKCQNFFTPRKTVDPNNLGKTASCLKPTLENPAYKVRINLDFNVARNANGAPLVLCAEDASGQMATVAYRVSYGQPVKEIKVPTVNYSMKTGLLRVNGNVIPKGNTNLNGTEVQITDAAGTLLGTGVVSKKKFDIRLPLDIPPKSIQVKIINTVSPTKIVKIKD